MNHGHQPSITIDHPLLAIVAIVTVHWPLLGHVSAVRAAQRLGPSFARGTGDLGGGDRLPVSSNRTVGTNHGGDPVTMVDHDPTMMKLIQVGL